MKFEYGRLSEKRNEEIENMQIINPFGEDLIFTMHIRMKHIIYLYAKINIILLHSVMKIILEKL